MGFINVGKDRTGRWTHGEEVNRELLDFLKREQRGRKAV